jgi:hypothetical protein
MQRGSLTSVSRKEGPDVWQFRWSEIDRGGKRLYHNKIVGTVEQYPDETAVRHAVVGLVRGTASRKRFEKLIGITIEHRT